MAVIETDYGTQTRPVRFGFRLIAERDLPAVHTRGRLYRHVRTGAQLLSLENEDENKVFGITFRTPPGDSTGIAHILEHAVLCGSEKYPIKKPYVELVKGSLKTFANAFTFPDKTCYPVASQNLQDFYNLIDVYLDAVFHPLLAPHILEQEGWHYTLAGPEEPLRYRGVVFNEMKGGYASPQRALSVKTQQMLFPDNAYGHDSGGDPAVIPDLTYEALRSFHRGHYHPSNARIFFYGDDPPEARLRLMDDALRGYRARPVDTAVSLHLPFSEPRTVTTPYPAGAESSERGNHITVSWALPEGEDPETSLALSLLAYLLVGNPASPLRKALTESGLGEDLVGGGLERELRQMFFSAGLRGVAPGHEGRVEALILETVERLAREGFDEDMIAAAFNTVEFRLRENNTGRYPRGLILMLRALTTWLHGGDPFTPLAFEAPLSALRARLEAGEPVFQRMLTELFVGNAHRLTLTLQADPDLRARWDAEEAGRLAEIRAQMDSRDLEAVMENARRLQEIQSRPDSREALATLPSLELSDLDREGKTIPSETVDAVQGTVYLHELPTNGIAYLDVGLDLRNVPMDLLGYVPLLGRVFTEMGTVDEDYAALSRRIARTTGGLFPTRMVSSHHQTGDPVAWLFLRGKARDDQTEALLGLLRDVLLGVRLDDRERFRQIALEAKSRLEAGIVSQGHRVVSRRLAARVHPAGRAAGSMSGLEYLFFLRDLVARLEEDWPAVLTDLRRVHELLVNGNAVLCNVTTEDRIWAQMQGQMDAFLEQLPAARAVSHAWGTQDDGSGEGWIIPAQVNYVGRGIDLYASGYRLHGSALAILRHLRATWLWDRVRVRGGAYGAYAVFDIHSGLLNYLSYRDPNLLETLEVFRGSSRYLIDQPPDEQERKRSIIGAVGDLDAYRLPDARGFTAMSRDLIGYTDETRQRLREELLGTRVEDFRAFGEALAAAHGDGLVTVMGPAEAIQEANERRPGLLDCRRLL